MTLGRHPSIPGERFADRLARVRAALPEHGIDGFLVSAGPDLEYLTGYGALPSERLTLLAIAPGQPPTLIVPRLERAAAEAGLRSPIAIDTWTETDDPYALVTSRLGPADAATRLAVSDRLWTSHLLELQRQLPTAEFRPATPVLRELRMRKDDDEISLLRLAAEAADRVVDAIATGRLVDRTEADVAREVRQRLVDEGHEEASFAIIASGPNSASPHHDAAERVISAGEPIVLDIGGRLGGYGSDVTRTLWVTGVDPARGADETFLRLFHVLADAQEAATRAVRPGVPCERIDTTAREIIEGADYGPNFIHRIGHGIGLEGHEEPYLVAGSTTPLDAGMAFWIEPGIYLEGRYGARIEDIVVCGEDGPIVLNATSRELRIVNG